MGTIKENHHEPYNWETESVYLIENDDYVEGGEEGVSNRQAKQFTRRTRNLHTRVATAEDEIDALQEQTPILLESTLSSAKEYTDTRETAINGTIDTKDAATLVTAKSYADQIVAALVDSSPEALNTLQELATALGNNPNFATDVLQAIGERATMVQMNTALEQKANANHTHDYAPKSHAHSGYAATNGSLDIEFNAKYLNLTKATGQWCYLGVGDNISAELHSTDLALLGEGMRLLFIGSEPPCYSPSTAGPRYTILHSGNFNPGLCQQYIGARSEEDVNKMYGSNFSCAIPIGGGSDGYINLFTGGSASSLAFRFGYGSGELYWRNSIDSNRWSGEYRRLWHSGNFDPGNYLKIISAGSKDATGGQIGNTQGKYISCIQAGGEYIFQHSLGHNNYAVVVTPKVGMVSAAISAQNASTFTVSLSSIAGHGSSHCDFSYIMYDLS